MIDLLDTNILIYLSKNRSPQVAERIDAVNDEDTVAMSFITWAELLRGAEGSQRRVQVLEKPMAGGFLASGFPWPAVAGLGLHGRSRCLAPPHRRAPGPPRPSKPHPAACNAAAVHPLHRLA